MNKNIYCSRKGGTQVGRKFFPHPRTSEILAAQLERHSIKMEARARRRDLKAILVEMAQKKTALNNYKQMMKSLRRRRKNN